MVLREEMVYRTFVGVSEVCFSLSEVFRKLCRTLLWVPVEDCVPHIFGGERSVPAVESAAHSCGLACGIVRRTLFGGVR